MSAGTPVGDAIQSGLAIAFPAAIEKPALRRICGTLAASCDEVVDATTDGSDFVCTFAFASHAGPLGVIVRLLGAETLAGRADIAAVLGAPIRCAVRLDSLVRAEARDETLRAERLLTALAALLAGELGGIACDDAGAMYDAGELRRLAGRGRTVVESEAFRAAVAARIVMPEAAPANGNGSYVFASAVTGPAPSDALPDITTGAAVAFVTLGAHLPLMVATRALLATNGAAGGNPDRLPVVLLAPLLVEPEAELAARAGISVVRDRDAFRSALTPAAGAADGAPAPVRATRERDELSIFSRALANDVVVELIVRRAFDVAVAAGNGATDGPALADVDDAAPPSDVPFALGRFGFDGALTSFYRLDLGTAHPFLRRLVDLRPDIATLLGGPPTLVVVCETVADPRRSGPRRFAALERADALGVSVAAELAAGGHAVAADASGAVYGANELLRLTAAHLGRSASWSARVAHAELGR